MESDGGGISARHLEEGLPFSEQNMRRSCRQLVAAMCASSRPTCGLRLDARSAGRLSLPGKERDDQCAAAKRLSVPAARTPPPSYEEVSAARTKLSVAPTPDLDSISATGTPFAERNSAAARQHPIRASNDPNASTSVRLVPPASQNGRRRFGDLSVQGDPSAPPQGKQQDDCTPRTIRSSWKATQQDWASGQLPNKQAGLGVYDGKEAASLIPSKPQFTHEPQRGDEKIRDSSLREELPTMRLSEEKTRGHEFTRAAPTHIGPRIVQLRWAAPIEAVVARVQPSQPVCAHSTSSMLGPRPKTALPPKTLPLSLPGENRFSLCSASKVACVRNYSAENSLQ